MFQISVRRFWIRASSCDTPYSALADTIFLLSLYVHPSCQTPVTCITASLGLLVGPRIFHSSASSPPGGRRCDRLQVLVNSRQQEGPAPLEILLFDFNPQSCNSGNFLLKFLFTHLRLIISPGPLFSISWNHAESLERSIGLVIPQLTDAGLPTRAPSAISCRLAPFLL